MRSRLIVRPRFLRSPLVVLQVAESKPYNYDPERDIGPGGHFEVWRDARPEDVAIMGEEKQPSRSAAARSKERDGGRVL